MLHQTTGGHSHRTSPLRVFTLIPIAVFLLALALLAEPVGDSPAHFLQLLLRVTAASLASCFICIAAYGFYRYLRDGSYGL